MSHQDAQMMHSYPDPTVVGVENSEPFYTPNNNTHSQQRLTSADDLRLAAQLSRGLEPMMGNNSGGELSDAPDAPQQDTSNNSYSQEQLLSQINQGRMDQGHYSLPDSPMGARKRSKVSRACDECRRKKIKCDATTESGDEQCSGCKRVGMTCEFSRVPQKRGPSKGQVCVNQYKSGQFTDFLSLRYIKDLADRLIQLEGAMQGQASDVPHGNVSPRETREYSLPPSAEQPRKRTYSSISNDLNTYQPQRPASNWPPLESSRNTAFNDSSLTGDSNSQAYPPRVLVGAMAPQPALTNGPDVVSQPNGSFDGMTHSEPNHTEHQLDWNDSIAEV